MQRRTLMAASAAALAFPALAQPQSKTPLSNAALAPNPAEFRKAMADFTQGRKPLALARRNMMLRREFEEA